MLRDKILCRRVNPKEVNLADRRTFYATYERVSRKNLPANVTIKEQRQSDQDAGIYANSNKKAGC